MNFAPVVLQVPEQVEVRKVDLAVELQILAYYEQRAEDRGAHGWHSSARDRPFRPFDSIDVTVEDIVEHDAAGVETCGRHEEPWQGPWIREACDGVPRQDVCERGRDVRRAKELEVAAE